MHILSTYYSLLTTILMLYIGSDHRGFELKGALKKYLAKLGEPFEDAGNAAFDPNDDYPDFASRVAEKVSRDPEQSRGIVICGSGIGVAVTADKFRGLRAGLCTSAELAAMGRRDDDINVLALAADITDEKTAGDILQAFLNTPFSGEERHKRRIEKIHKIET